MHRAFIIFVLFYVSPAVSVKRWTEDTLSINSFSSGLEHTSTTSDTPAAVTPPYPTPASHFLQHTYRNKEGCFQLKWSIRHVNYRTYIPATRSEQQPCCLQLRYDIKEWPLYDTTLPWLVDSYISLRNKPLFYNYTIVIPDGEEGRWTMFL